MGRIQTARLENFIRRWASIKGGGSVLSETLGEVFPVLDLENLSAENFLPAGWFLIAGHNFETGGVAQNAGIQIANPADSGLIVVLEKIGIFSTVGQSVTFGSAQGIFSVISASVTPRNRDSRTGNTFNGMVDLNASVNANTEFDGQVNVLASQTREYEVPNGLAVLAPGSAFSVVTITNNTLLRCNFSARVRIAEPSELSF